MLRYANAVLPAGLSTELFTELFAVQQNGDGCRYSCCIKRQARIAQEKHCVRNATEIAVSRKRNESELLLQYSREGARDAKRMHRLANISRRAHSRV